MTFLDRLAFDLPEHFDPGALSRGRDYADGGAVDLHPGDIDPDGDELVVLAFVRGTQRSPYVVRLVITDLGGFLDVASQCSCPVSYQCKHGAALALVLARSATPVPVSWTDWFDQLLDDLAPLAPAEHEPRGVALEVTLDQPRHTYYYVGSRQPELALRPLRPGAKQRWVKTGLNWHEVPTAAMHGSYDIEQLRTLDRLATALTTNGRYWHQQAAPVEAFGPAVVALVQEAIAAGVEIVTRAPLSSCEIVSERLALGVDVRADDDGAAVRLGVQHGTQIWSGEELMLFGDPVHTVGQITEGHVQLAALDRRLAKGPARALQRREPLHVPPEAVAELPDYLRRLTRLVPVRSGDDSLALPAPMEPRLRVTVSWRTAATADVEWSWRYGELGCPVAGSDDLGGLRDRAAEHRASRQLPDLDTRTRIVTGADTVSLALLELPAWRAIAGLDVVELDRPEFREAVEAPVISIDLAPPTDDAIEHTDWLDLEVLIHVDGEPVPLADVLAALTLGHEFLVLPSGLYVPTDTPEFTKLADAVRAAAEIRERRVDDDRVRVGRHDLGVLAQLGDVGEVAGGATAWIERAQALRDVVALPSPEPTGVVTELRAYQRDGFAWLVFLWQHGLGGILADDMGLGKTLQVLALVAHTRAQGETAPFLVVAPTSVVSAWATEAALHTPGLRVRTVSGTGARRTESIVALAGEADVVVTSYTLVRLEAAEYAAVEWGAVVLDEAQQVKNHKSQAHSAIRKLRAPFKLAVSGTPFENRLLELWSLLAIVSPGLYPSPRGFHDHVVRPVEKLKDDAALRRFTRRIKPFVLRRTKELVAADLPPKQEQVLTVELLPQHRKLYDSHLAKERQRILGLLDDFDENRVAVLAALTRLRQLALDAALVDPAHDAVGSAKLDVLLDHLEEIAAEGHRALVFSTFTGFLRRARARLEAAGIDYTYLDGSTTGRAAVIEAFRAGAAPVFLISLKAGGVGLTLTEADYVFVLDPWWNPAAEAQAVDRAHRIGQQRTVMVYRLVATDTIEEKVMALKERKAALFAKVIDGEGANTQGIDAADIRALFE